MKKTILALSILSILFYACEKEPDLTSTQACQDHSTAENIFNDVGYIVELALKLNGELNQGNKEFPIFNKLDENSSDIDTLIIDFGPSNIVWPENNNKIRRGKINITYTGKYRDTYSVITNTFDHYYINNYLVQGERIITNQGINNNGNMWFKINVNNASITPPNGNGTIDWESEREREWVSGEGTYSLIDDVYKATGNASGNGVNEIDFTMTIIDTLKIDLNCLESSSCIITSGTAKISPSGEADRIINYGNSLCDCNIEVLINGTTYPIVIRN